MKIETQKEVSNLKSLGIWENICVVLADLWGYDFEICRNIACPIWGKLV